MSKIINTDNANYKIVMIRTVDNVEPVSYRLVNLSTYEIEEIAAYRIFDEIVNKHRNIVNIRCSDNKLIIVNEDGYDSDEELIVVDVLDKERQNLYDWALTHGEQGQDIISRYDDSKNEFSLSNTRIDSEKKLAWTCENGHTIWCGFATYMSTKCKCPICEAKDNEEVISFEYWCILTRNFDLLDYYKNAVNADLNKKDSTEIGWNSDEMVYFKCVDEVKQVKLSNITLGKEELQFSTSEIINITKERRK